MNIDFDRLRSDIRNGRLACLGNGAGRRVFDMGGGCVVKIAQNGFGIRQNRNEYRLSRMYSGDLLARVLSVSEGHYMLVMQAARPLRELSPVLNYFNVKTGTGLSRVPELVDLAKKHHLVMREFVVPRNWGLIGDRPVIIDYGFVQQRRRSRFF